MEDLTRTMLEAVEDELRQVVARANGSSLEEMHHMLAYHLGWEGEGSGKQARGKRVRPLLLLLVCAASGGAWRNALSGAAAVELIHNFSLIHDDIQDNSPLRRGRPTVWTKWGIPQAINAGDAMFSLAQLAVVGLEKNTSPAVALKAVQILNETCLQLTQGQYLDMHYEARGDLNLDAYWPMVSGKTAALLTACTHIGALAAGAEPDIVNAYRHFGRALGLAFQAEDDLLGMWGEPALTGKSSESDLVQGKKTLPVLYGLSQGGSFAQRWAKGPFRENEALRWAEQLTKEGAREFTQEHAGQLTKQALQSLEEARPQGEAGEKLRQLANQLMNRKA